MATSKTLAANAAPALSLSVYSSVIARQIGDRVAAAGDTLADVAAVVRACPDLRGFGDPDFDYNTAAAKLFYADFSDGVVTRYSQKHGERLLRAIVPAGADTADGFQDLTREEFDKLRAEKNPPTLLAVSFHLAFTMSSTEFGALEKRPANSGGSGMYGKAYKKLIEDMRAKATNYRDVNWKRLKLAASPAKRTRTAAASDFETWLFGATGKPGALDLIETRAANAAKRGDTGADTAKIKLAIEAFRKVWKA